MAANHRYIRSLQEARAARDGTTTPGSARDTAAAAVFGRGLSGGGAQARRKAASAGMTPRRPTRPTAPPTLNAAAGGSADLPAWADDKAYPGGQHGSAYLKPAGTDVLFHLEQPRAEPHQGEDTAMDTRGGEAMAAGGHHNSERSRPLILVGAGCVWCRTPRSP